MPSKPDHIKWLVDTEKDIKTVDGKSVRLFEFKPKQKDQAIMSAWAKHFRNHYCFDSEIDFLRTGTGLSRKEYLLATKFPTDVRGFGPGIRAGDFGEILVADYLEFLLGHWVPRTRYGNKTIRDESTKGSDLIGFKLFDNNVTPNDILTIFEVKTQFSGKTAEARLQDAINDSGKDELRKAESLNAMKQRLMDKGSIPEAKTVARFQNPVDKPYTEQFGAAALFSTDVLDKKSIAKSSTNGHPKRSSLILIVISSDNFMKLVHELYKIAADEA